MGLFGKVMEPLGNGASLEEVEVGEAGHVIYCWVPHPAMSLLSNLPRCEQAHYTATATAVTVSDAVASLR